MRLADFILQNIEPHPCRVGGVRPLHLARRGGGPGDPARPRRGDPPRHRRGHAGGADRRGALRQGPGRRATPARHGDRPRRRLRPARGPPGRLGVRPARGRVGVPGRCGRSVIRLCCTDARPDLRDMDDLTRFNESIDQSITKAVRSFMRKVDQQRRAELAHLSRVASLGELTADAGARAGPAADRDPDQRRRRAAVPRRPGPGPSRRCATRWPTSRRTRSGPRDIIQRLRDMLKRDRPAEFAPVDLNDVIRTVERLLRGERHPAPRHGRARPGPGPPADHRGRDPTATGRHEPDAERVRRDGPAGAARAAAARADAHGGGRGAAWRRSSRTAAPGSPPT